VNAPLSAVSLLHANQRALATHLAALRRRLEGADVPTPDPREAPDPRQTIATLGRIARLFGLSRFEAETLLLAAAADLDSGISALCAAAHGDAGHGRAGNGGAGRPWPSFGLALALLPEPHWSALTPDAPLRRWQLVELDSATGIATGRLRASEALLHHLAGIGGPDERLSGWVRQVPPQGRLPASHAEAAARAATLWSATSEAGACDAGACEAGASEAGTTGAGEVPPVLDPPVLDPPVLELTGPDPAMLREAAAHIAERAGLGLHAVAHADLPARLEVALPVLRLIQRDAMLAGAALLIEDAVPCPALAAMLDLVQCRLILTAAKPGAGWGERRPVSFALALPEGAEARRLWLHALPPGVDEATLDRAVSQFRLPPAAIRATAHAVAAAPPHTRPEVLWTRCRAEAGMPAVGLAERIEPCAQWDDLVLPAASARLLRTLAAEHGQRSTVLERWGFAARGKRGLGTATLFAGPSGTGKTMAAEVIAGALALDLYRIDLSQVVSKWIGETEKNLAQLFDAAEAGAAVLLFDEADALFGKRSEVKDSHDRYANIEVSFLLQRLESYRGLAILATNSEQALDTAFLRRLRFIVQFPLPDTTQRAAIWRRIFPPQTPTEALRPEKLARLAVSGGTIRNIALTAAYLAADAGDAVGMGHIKQAAEIECAKLRRPLSSNETGDWVCA
jgi:hypothetical protein